MKESIKVEFPSELSIILKMDKVELSREIKRLTLLKLYELGKISSGKAARLPGMSRVDFLELLEQYNISSIAIQDKEALLEDLHNA